MELIHPFSVVDANREHRVVVLGLKSSDLNTLYTLLLFFRVFPTTDLDHPFPLEDLRVLPTADVLDFLRLNAEEIGQIVTPLYEEYPLADQPHPHSYLVIPTDIGEKRGMQALFKASKMSQALDYICKFAMDLPPCES
jgi:hypothetical protein